MTKRNWMDKSKPADQPPSGKHGLWTRDVLVETSRGNHYAIAYMNGPGGGCWQRPSWFEKGETVVRWAELPEDFGT